MKLGDSHNQRPSLLRNVFEVFDDFHEKYIKTETKDSIRHPQEVKVTSKSYFIPAISVYP